MKSLFDKKQEDWEIDGLETLVKSNGPSLEGYVASLWIPTLKGFPVCGLRLVARDPLASHDDLTAKVLGILLQKKRALRTKDILDTLKEAGMGKEIETLKKGVYRALQSLKSRGSVISGAKLWMATAHIEGGKPCSP
jgi:hypothetical protein